MKKFFAIISAVCLILSCTPVQAANVEETEVNQTQEVKEETIVRYTTTVVNVRQKPSKKSNRITKLPKGMKVTVSRHNKNWYKFHFDGEYYVHADYFTAVAPNKPLELDTIEKVKDYWMKSNPAQSTMVYSPSQFRNKGVISWGGYTYTWYSQRVLPGGGLRIPGRHLNSNGYVCDSNGYIVLASSWHSKGTILPTPFGANGKVYDVNPDNSRIDVYCNF